MASMQYDVKAAFSTADATLVPYRVRLKGVFFAVTNAGADLIIYDSASGATGEVLLTLPCDVAGQHNVYIPGEGILAQNGIYLDINGASGVTVFYG
jgi:hypothetical protein